MDIVTVIKSILDSSNVGALVAATAIGMYIISSKTTSRTLEANSQQMKETRDFMREREEKHDLQINKLLDDQRKDSERWRETFGKFENTMNNLAVSNSEMAESSRTLAAVIENKYSDGSNSKVFDRRQR